jgi:hypothetical protein
MLALPGLALAQVTTPPGISATSPITCVPSALPPATPRSNYEQTSSANTMCTAGDLMIWQGRKIDANHDEDQFAGPAGNEWPIAPGRGATRSTDDILGPVDKQR